MKSIQAALLCAGLCFVAHSNATTVPIFNGNFDAIHLGDGSTFSQVSNWRIESGLAGLHNPTSTSFIGEDGEGMHSNMLYMIDGATVSQTLNFKALENTSYQLTFDVGQRNEAGMQDYTVVVKAGDVVLHSAKNAVIPTEPGTFGRSTVNFRSNFSTTDVLTLEVQTEGTGHVYFDNFAMSYTRDISVVKNYIKVVAYGSEMRFASQSSGACTVSHSLTSVEISSPYMVASAEGCQCNNSHKVFVNVDRFPHARGEQRYKDFYQCVVSTEV